MLRNVLEDYLSSINEREFDYPLSSLLQAMGFYDIHFTHGPVEFGKDFIAKREEDGVTYQYGVQSKKGDINQNLWRNEIKGQLEEALASDLSHPQFDTSLPRKVILATTGRLTGNARLACQEYKRKLEESGEVEEMVFWERERLAQLLEVYGLSGVHHITAKGLAGYGQFYLVYSKAIQGTLSDREIEEFSRFWLDESLEYRNRILRGAIEAEIIAAKLIESNRLYEAITCYLSFARLMLHATVENPRGVLIDVLKELLQAKLLPLCRRLVDDVHKDWEGVDKSFVRLCAQSSPFPMVQYLVWCARVIEVTALRYFLTEDESQREALVTFLSEFIDKEEGCGHIPGDRYATSLVWPILVLAKSSRDQEASKLIVRSSVWLCDRVANAYGLATYASDEAEETAILIGYPYECVKVERNRSSFLATVLTDLAAFLGDKQLYADVVNDLAACEIVYSYWQFPDTKAIFIIDTEECLAYANVGHADELDATNGLSYAEHMRDEPQSFGIVERAG